MNQLTKEQAIKISELHHAWKTAHPEATRRQIEQAANKIKHTVLNQSK